MRTVKFRGKDVKTSHWVYGAYHEHIDITPAALYKDAESRENHIKEHTHYLIMQDAFSDYCMPRNIQCFDVTSETIGQFTGLYDCHGKEIYEGDILRFGNSPSGVCEVKWNETLAAFCIRFYFENELGSRPLGDWVICERSIEIIGNIHDNPELFEGGEK